MFCESKKKIFFQQNVHLLCHEKNSLKNPVIENSAKE